MGKRTEDNREALTARRVQHWARDLIDLSQRNHALYHRPTKRSSLDILCPDPLVLHRLLVDAKPLAFFVPPAQGSDRTSTKEDLVRQARPHDIVTDRVEPQDLIRTLTQLMRSTNQDWLDRAVRTLYISFGQLVWSDHTESTAEVRSPLVYFPVILRRGGTRQPFLVERTDDDPVINPSLMMKLEDSFGVDLSGLSNAMPDLSTMDEVLEQVEETVDPLGWHVEHAAALKRATFHKEAMYRDLQTNLSTIARHPLVRSLACDQESDGVRAPFEVPQEAELDVREPPEAAHLVLDADASQRRAVLAAKHGLSFVMDGPPGTGKSQTIVNMIAELVASRRSVLFVSEKAAALEVVAKRLADAGLSDFMLELHSHKANRREVVQELARCVRQRPRVERSMEESERARLEARRKELNDYASAINDVRLPLERSVHWVIGRVLSIQDAPNLAAPDVDLQALDRGTLGTILEDASILAASWERIHSPGFLWRDAANPDRPSADEARRVIREVLARQSELAASGGSRARSIGMQPPENQAGVAEISDRLEILSRRPPQASAKLLAATNAEFASLQNAVENAAELADRARKADRKLEHAYPEGWRTATVSTPEIVERVSEIANEVFPRLPARKVTLAHAEKVLSKLSEVTKDCEEIALEAEELAEELGFKVDSLTVEWASDLAQIAGRSDSAHKPPSEWLTATGAQEVREALEQIVARRRSAGLSLATAQGLLQESFLKDNIHLQLEPALRLVLRTRGRPAALERSARQARRLVIQAVTKRPRDLSEQDVNVIAKAWKARQRVAEAETRHRRLLDRFIVGATIDIEGAREALDLADAVRAAGGAGLNLAAAAPIFCEESPAAAQAGQRGTGLERSLRRLRSNLRALKEAGFTPPNESRLQPLAAMIHDVSEQVGELIRLTRPVLGRRSDETGVADLRKDLQLLDEARLCERGLVDALADLDAAAGVRRLPETAVAARLDTIRSAKDWASDVRAAFGGPLALAHAEALVQMDGASEAAVALRDATKRLEGAIETFERFIGKPMARRLRPRLRSTFPDTAQLLASLLETADQLPEWWEHAEAGRSFRDNGLESLLEEAVELGVPAETVPRSVERAVLSRWLEQILRSDRRLHNLNPSKRNSRVAEFQRLDRALLADSARRVVEACAAQLPGGEIGAVGLILKEANKKSRHLPVRTLFERVGQEISRLKPCLMMSPLSVSQYIPPDWRFDVVIFDEASQIPPQDAINCIYRGNQLIIAGDDRQLPPTAFFELMSQDDEGDDELDDFESVLGLAKGSAALADLGLRWHYRSRHEDLITFSNTRFYDGDLVTYPGALTEGPTLGVVHHLVADGIYNRGSRKDNPREAEKVAEIVAAHVRQSPHLSIGVVALSSAQAEAIEDAVDRLRRKDDALDRAFRSDRLDGFFVKNLENVQGDDRDIIVLSIGYGPDDAGRMTMNFGPMNQAGGWRRLNVAVTRARNRMDVVASFTADRIRAPDPSSSLASLQAYLAYAERGPRTVVEQADDRIEPQGSSLEEEILRTVRSWGYDAVPQVGSVGYRIDVGVLDPDDPSRYLLGIECDGATYHSSKVARDRDRLRQQVLEGLGWRLHRAWGPAWFHNRSAAESRLRDAIESARVSVSQSTSHAEQMAAETPPRIQIVREDRSLGGPPAWTVPYEEFVPQQNRLDSPRTAAGRAKLRAVLLAAVRAEAPVHIGRLRELTNLALRTPLSGVTEELFLETIDSLRSDGYFNYSDDFVRRDPNEFRVRHPVADGFRRSIDQIPQEEVELAVMLLVQDSLTATMEEIERGVRDVFGFRRLGGRISEAVAAAVAHLEEGGSLKRGHLEKFSVAASWGPPPQ